MFLEDFIDKRYPLAIEISTNEKYILLFFKNHGLDKVVTLCLVIITPLRALERSKIECFPRPQKESSPEFSEINAKSPIIIFFKCCRTIALVCKKSIREHITRPKQTKEYFDPVWRLLTRTDTWSSSSFSGLNSISYTYLNQVVSFTFSPLLQAAGGQDTMSACEALVTNQKVCLRWKLN